MMIFYIFQQVIQIIFENIQEFGERAPKLNRLGSKEWENTKQKVKSNLREVARDLIELYAKREKIKGFAFFFFF